MTLATIWRIVIWLWVVSEIAIGIGTRAQKSSASVRDRGSLILFWVVIGIATFTAGAVREIQGETLPITSHWAKGVGLAILAVGLALRWTAILTLGRYFTSNVAIQEGQSVLRTGVYRFMGRQRACLSCWKQSHARAARTFLFGIPAVRGRCPDGNSWGLLFWSRRRDRAQLHLTA
jgi:hypothetical protein